jgi:hypothetical protein
VYFIFLQERRDDLVQEPEDYKWRGHDRYGTSGTFAESLPGRRDDRQVVVMKTQSNFMDIVKSSYMVLIIAMLGIFAFISAVLIAWPALAYIGAKLFN